MKKKKNGWPKRCLSLICVMVLISMIILQSIPVTYVFGSNAADSLQRQNTDMSADTFTPESEEALQTISTSEIPSGQDVQTEYIQQDEIFSDGSLESSSELPDLPVTPPSESETTEETNLETGSETGTEFTDGNLPEASPAEPELTEIPEIFPEETQLTITPTETPIETPISAPAENMITKYDYRSEEINVKVTLTDPADLPDNAQLAVTPAEISQEVQEQIEKEAVRENKTIEKIRSYDIRFMLDQEEIQPGNTEKVEVSFQKKNNTTEENSAGVQEISEESNTEAQEISEESNTEAQNIPEYENTSEIPDLPETEVYRIDNQNEIEDMNGSINQDGNIEFKTTHFSTYVFVDKVPAKESSEGTDQEITEETTEKTTEEIGAPQEDMQISDPPVQPLHASEKALGNAGLKLTSDKKATVTDEDNRIFQIDLNAEVTGREEGEEPKGASIVLVMDASGSMAEGGKSLNDIKTAAKNFVKAAGEASENSEISVIWYQGTEAGYSAYGGDDATITVSDFYKLNSNGTEILKQKINSGKAKGGTPMGEALEAAKNQLNSAKYPDKYVLFFTDGMPGHQDGYDSWNCRVANRAYNAANEIKKTAILYTVGYALDGTLIWTPGHPANSTTTGHGIHDKSTSAEKYLSDYIATSGCAYTTSSSDGLSEIFKDLAGKIGELFTVKADRITDVIDSRFVLTEQSRQELLKLNEGKETPVVEIQNHADGTTSIIWTGEAARIGNKEAEDPEERGWKASFQIQAKDDFIGGNMIPTNGTASGIYLEGGNVQYFPEPSVNVKLLSLGIADKETTVFKGDPVTPLSYAGELSDTLFIRELVRTAQGDFVTTKTGLDQLGFPTLSEEQRDILNKEGSLTVGESGMPSYEYRYPGSNDAVGYFTLTYHTAIKEDGTLWGTMQDHNAEQSGKEIEKYQLTVTYHPYSKETRKSMSALSGVQEPTLPDSTQNGGGTEVTENDIAPVTGTYTVHAIAGELQIRKKLTSEAAADTTFTFVVKKDGKEIATAAATVKKGETEAVAKFPAKTFVENEKAEATEAETTKTETSKGETEQGSEKLKDLARGTYIITENATEGYALESIAKCSETNCKFEISAPSATDPADGSLSAAFFIGTGEDGSDALTPANMQNQKGRLGAAEFTNKRKTVDIEFRKTEEGREEVTLKNVSFALYEADADWIQGKLLKENIISGNDGRFTLENLPAGRNYLLVETKAVDGYMLPQHPWRITVSDNGTVTVKKLQTENGAETETEIKAVTEKTETSGSEEKAVYQIENKKISALPDTGSTGTFLFTISGITVIMAGVLLLYINKRKEEKTL